MLFTVFWQLFQKNNPKMVPKLSQGGWLVIFQKLMFYFSKNNIFEVPRAQKIAKKICELVEIDFNYKMQPDFDIESFKGPF